jgi:hypothetical protein
MMFKLKSLLSRLLHLKKAPNSEDFSKLEIELMKAAPKARSSFQRDLRQKLKARHQELMEEQIEKESGFLYVHRFAASMMLVLILVAGGGTVIVSASGAPVPQNRGFESINSDWHPDVSPITIDFDKSMMQSSVEDAFSIYPQVNGQLVWENRQTVHFLPDEPLDPNQQYVVNISKKAKSLFQKPISAEFEQKINVFSPELPPRIQNQTMRIQELKESSKTLTGGQKDEVIQKIRDLEKDLEWFFEQEQNGPVDGPTNQFGPKVQPSSA